MSLCTAIDFQIEDFLTNSAGLGLNLSTNNGLDLSCPTYEEGLNLSNQQNGQGGGSGNNHGSGHHQQFTYNESMVLNLTQQPVGNQHQSHLQQSNRSHHTIGQSNMHILQQPQNYTSYIAHGQGQLEVGLNLSLQKSYASQSQPQADYYNHFGNQEQNSGYVYSMASNSNTIEQQRNSPLNLERRSSPLNLTSVQVSGNSGRPYGNEFAYPNNASNYQQQTYGYYGQPMNQTQSTDSSMFVQNMFDDGQYYVSNSNEMIMGQQDNQQPQAQHQMHQSQTHQQVHQPQTHQQVHQPQTQQQVHQPQTQQQVHQQHGGQKIRLFCSSCCTEFNSTLELNKHMDRHLTEALSAMQGDLQDDQQHQMHHQPEVQNLQIQQHEMLTSYQDQQQRPQLQSCEGKHQQQIVQNWEVNDPYQVLAPQPVCQNDANIVGQNMSLNDIQTPNMSVMSTMSTPSMKKQPSRPLPATLNSTSGMEMSNNSTKKSNEPHEICADCSMAFPTGIDLKKHMDLAHQGRTDNIYQCSKCSQEFSSKKDLKDHVEAHNQERCISCPKCGLRLSNQAILKRHLLRVHEKSSQSLKCQQCGKGFYEKHDLARHVKTHSIPKCSFCHKTLNPNVNHKCKKSQAEAIPENPDLKCKICTAQLKTKVEWGIHMWKHTKDSSYIQIPTVNSKTPEQISQTPKATNSPTVPRPAAASVASQKNVEIIRAPKVPSSASTKPLPPISTLGGGISQSGFSSWMVKDFPQAPDAHATSYMQAQLSEPLCLQKSFKVDIPPKEQIKPLNMQVVMNSNQ